LRDGAQALGLRRAGRWCVRDALAGATLLAEAKPLSLTPVPLESARIAFERSGAPMMVEFDPKGSDPRYQPFLNALGQYFDVSGLNEQLGSGIESLRSRL